MSLGKSIKHYRVLVRSNKRSLSSGDSFNDQKMQQISTKVFHSNQWKAINQLRIYLSKLPQSQLLQDALKKEIAHLMQRLQPKVYGDELIRYFAQATTEGSSSNLSLPDVFSTFKIKMGSKEKKTTKSLPQPTISKEAIESRTLQLLSLIGQNTSEQEKLEKINSLCIHLRQYPIAKHLAVKEGAIPKLLQIRYGSKHLGLCGATNEALSSLGYTDPVKGEGIRILSIDGGGTRGILVIQMLQKLEEMAGKPIFEMFDLICGVSTGAILAGLIVVQKKSLKEIEKIYTSMSTKIFTQHPIRGTGGLVWSHAYYDTVQWEQILKSEVGELSMITTQRNQNTPKLLFVSAVVNQARLAPYVFRNYNLPCKVQSRYVGGSHHMVWESVRASAAAPTFFEEFRIGNTLHQDGGILVNNPTAVAIHEAKLLWPSTPIQCVVSFGTGRTAPNPIEPDVPDKVSASSWKSKFLALIDSATDTEGVHSMLSDLLPSKSYYRFNPYLTEMVSISEISPDKIELLKRDAMMYLRKNEEKFREAANSLSVEKGMISRIGDRIRLQFDMNGFCLAKY